MSIRLRTKLLWIRILLLPHKLQIWCLLQARSSLIFRQTIERGLTLKLVRDMIITCSQMHHTSKYFQHSSMIWQVWLKCWEFIYGLSGWGFESRCCHLNVRYGACFEQGVSWHSDRVCIHSQTSTWHDNNLQAKSQYR